MRRTLTKDELNWQLEMWLLGCKHDHDTYVIYKECKECPSKKECKQAEKQIKEIIQKPEVTKEWYEEKARDLITMVANLYPHEGNPCVIPKSKARNFIRSLVEKIPRVG